MSRPRLRSDNMRKYLEKLQAITRTEQTRNNSNTVLSSQSSHFAVTAICFAICDHLTAATGAVHIKQNVK